MTTHKLAALLSVLPVTALVVVLAPAVVSTQAPYPQTAGGRGQPPAGYKLVRANGADYDPDEKPLLAAVAELRQLNANVVQTNARLDRIELALGGRAAAPKVSLKQQKQETIRQHCVGCHTPARIDDGKDGGKFYLWADDKSEVLVPLDEAGWAKVDAQIGSGAMPPKPRPPVPVEQKKIHQK